MVKTLRCPQYGIRRQGKRRTNNAALPAPVMVRGKHGKPVELDLSAHRPMIGRADPPRDKKASRNDYRHYQVLRTPDRKWLHQPTLRLTLAAPSKPVGGSGRKA